MIEKDSLLQIGDLFKPHGYKGEMKCDVPFPPDLFADPEQAFFVEQDNILVPFFVESARGTDEATSFLKFADVDSDLEAARLFTKKKLFADKTYVAAMAGMDVAEFELASRGMKGYEVIDAGSGKRLGVVDDIEEGIEYPYLNMIKDIDGEQIGIPYVEDMVTEIVEAGDADGHGKIFVNLPEGFLEI